MLGWVAISALAKHDGARIDESAALPLALGLHSAYGWGFIRGLIGSSSLEES